MNREPTILGLKLPTKFYKNVSTMSIETIDTRISDIRLELKELSDNIEFKLIREFDFKSSINEFEPMKYMGVYLVEIKTDKNKHSTFENWFAEFKDKWVIERFKNKYVPNPKQKRIEKHLKKESLDEWIPMYIGKAMDIQKRLNEHLKNPIEKYSFSLKLNERSELKNETFRFSTIKLNTVNFNWLAPEIESLMREKYNPILGK